MAVVAVFTTTLAVVVVVFFQPVMQSPYVVFLTELVEARTQILKSLLMPLILALVEQTGRDKVPLAIVD